MRFFEVIIIFGFVQTYSFSYLKYFLIKNVSWSAIL